MTQRRSFRMRDVPACLCPGFLFALAAASDGDLCRGGHFLFDYPFVVELLWVCVLVHPSEI